VDKNGDAWLGDNPADSASAGEELFRARIFQRIGRKDYVVIENPPVPFLSIRKGRFLGVDDLARLRRCHRQTIIRHVQRGLLKPDRRRIGREYFFPIEEVKRWIERVPDLRRGPLKLAKKGPGLRVGSDPKSDNRKKRRGEC
jgi:hypothetical protein